MATTIMNLYTDDLIARAIAEGEKRVTPLTNIDWTGIPYVTFAVLLKDCKTAQVSFKWPVGSLAKLTMLRNRYLVIFALVALGYDEYDAGIWAENTEDDVKLRDASAAERLRAILEA